MHYCIMGHWTLVSNALIVLWIVVLLAILMVVADRFFCPALEVISDFFKLPPNVAGATLLSFGNGAPDLFTQLAAVSSMDSTSVPIALGEPVGGGLFVSNVVLAAVVLVGGRGASVKVERAAFLRDASFYAGATLITVGVCFDGTISLLETAVMLAYYGAFVLYIVVFERKKSTALHLEESLHFQQVWHQAHGSAAAEGGRPPSERDNVSAHETVLPLSPLAPRRRAECLFGEAAPLLRADSKSGSGACEPGPLAPANRRLGKAITMMPRIGPLRSFSGSDLPEALVHPSDEADAAGPGAEADACAPRATWAERAKMPLVCLLRLTMPEVGMDDNVCFPKVYAVLLPLTMPLFVVFAKGLALAEAAPLNGDALLYGLLCSAFSSLVIFSIYPSNGRHYGILSGLFTALAFGMSILWMDVAAGEMVRACKCLGFIHGLSQAMLGVTVLAWANSVGDLVANVSMAADGFPSMAVAACFASPLFTMVGGLGLSFTVAVLLHGPLRFQPKLPLEVAFAFAVASVFRFLIMVPMVYGWQLTRTSAMSMLAFYIVFQAVYLYFIAYYREAHR